MSLARATSERERRDLVTREVMEESRLIRFVLISGFEKSAAAIRGGRAAWLIEAADGSADGRGKLLALARHQTPPPGVCGTFSAEELGLALGLENVIHAVLLAGGRADRWTDEVRRLAGFRALRPGSWDQATPSGDAGAGAESGSGEALDGRGSGS